MNDITAISAHIGKFIAKSPDGKDELRATRVFFDLGSDPFNVHVEGFGVTHVVAPPDAVNELPSSEDATSVTEQVFQEIKLLQWKRHAVPRTVTTCRSTSIATGPA